MLKTEKEIHELAMKVDEFSPSKFPGMTYESGIAAALQWVLGEWEGDTPLDEEAP